MEEEVKEALQRELETIKMECSLYEFVKGAWPVMEGDVPFVEGWHIELVCAYLEETFERRIKRLLINIPPRTSKSTVISVAFPAWVWIHQPGQRFLYASYLTGLSLEHSLKCRRLIESPWYQDRWGKRFKISRSQRAKGHFDNNRQGFRMTTSVSAGATGRGANFTIADDPNSASDGTSPVKRAAAIDWWNIVWPSRLNNSKRDVKIVVQQRVHEQDITGEILSHNKKDDWVTVILPMEYESGRFKANPNHPQLEDQRFKDPRTEEGELLCADRFGPNELEELLDHMGAYNYAGQYQQRPAPEEGGIIKKAWFRWWKEANPPPMKLIIQSWDTAYSDKATSDYSACTTWGIFLDENEIENLYLLSSWRDRVGFPELRERAVRLFNDYRDVYKEKQAQFGNRPSDMLLIEAKASGSSLIQVLRRAGIPASPIVPKESKLIRANLVTYLIEGGRVWLPARPDAYTKLYPYADEFLQACAVFPNSDSCDLVDSMSQALSKVRTLNIVDHPTDEQPAPNYKEHVRVY